MRRFSARETEWLRELDGIELAPFWRRALAFVLDWVILYVALIPILIGGSLGYFKLREMWGQPVPKSFHFDMRPQKFEARSDDPELQQHANEEWVHVLMDVAVPALYFGLFTFWGGGRSPGKRILRIRVVSLMHPHLTLWHSLERALGYGAAALEGGFGFVQFFIHPYRRCVQDRIAETIVVTERSFKQLAARSVALQHGHPEQVPDGAEVSSAEEQALDNAESVSELR